MVEWLVKPGDRVKRGDVVAVVETQKGAIEIEIFQAGQIEQILVDLHSKVPVGTPLARIRTEGEAKRLVRQRLRRRQRRPFRSRRRLGAGARCAAIATARCASARRQACGRRRRRGGLLKSVASIFQRSPAAVRQGRSPTLTLNVVSEKPARRRKRSGPSGLISTRCEPPSPPRWRDRNGKSRTIIFEHQVDVTACEQWLSAEKCDAAAR